MLLKADLLLHVYTLVGPELAEAFCACTTVPVLGSDPEVIHGINP